MALNNQWQCCFYLKCEVSDFCGGSVVKNPRASAGDMRSISGQKSSRASGQFNLCAVTAEHQLLTGEATNKEASLQLEKAPHSNEDQCTPKIKT